MERYFAGCVILPVVEILLVRPTTWLPRLYVVQFPDGKHAATIIAECMIANYETDGNQHLLLNAVVDHERLDSAVPKSDGFITMRTRLTGRSQRCDGCVISGWTGQPHGRFVDTPRT